MRKPPKNSKKSATIRVTRIFRATVNGVPRIAYAHFVLELTICCLMSRHLTEKFLSRQVNSSLRWVPRHCRLV